MTTTTLLSPWGWKMLALCGSPSTTASRSCKRKWRGVGADLPESRGDDIQGSRARDDIQLEPTLSLLTLIHPLRQGIRFRAPLQHLGAGELGDAGSTDSPASKKGFPHPPPPTSGQAESSQAAIVGKGPVQTHPAKHLSAVGCGCGTVFAFFFVAFFFVAFFCIGVLCIIATIYFGCSPPFFSSLITWQSRPDLPGLCECHPPDKARGEEGCGADCLNRLV